MRRIPVRGGNPLLAHHVEGMVKLAQIMSRFPNSIFVGPGNAKLWTMDEHFDYASTHMLDILSQYGVTHINAVEMMQRMTKRNSWHFRDTVDNRTYASRILEHAIDVSDAVVRFGFARHFLEIAQANEDFTIHNLGPIPTPTQVLANQEARDQALDSLQRLSIQRQERLTNFGS